MRRWRNLGRWLLHLAIAVLILLPCLWLVAHRWIPVQVTPLMVIRWLDGADWQHDWVAFEEIDRDLIAAVIASEDNRFCQHRGVDWGAIQQAQAEVEQGQRASPRGASTLSQQTIKNLLLWPEKSRTRKALELTYVTLLEALWTKLRILETYLNIVEFGPGIYGAEAAAQHYFGVRANALTPRQSALLATALPNPLARNPAKPSTSHAARASRIERRMRSLEGHLGCLPPAAKP
ncbi:MAG: monofunctional biosynthetic peptidoglycan transglycosylase [Rhodospirillales bacterium]